jgi:mono/diheme cytochrome c family protein
MRNQPSIKSFQARMAVPAANSIAFNLTGISISETNPIEPNSQNLKIGQTAYSYYCSFCHGDKGIGNGPVGESYIPKPSNLLAAEIQNLSDANLYQRMLRGTGHEPVLERIVEPQYRWYIVLYVRNLGQQKK